MLSLPPTQPSHRVSNHSAKLFTTLIDYFKLPTQTKNFLNINILSYMIFTSIAESDDEVASEDLRLARFPFKTGPTQGNIPF